MIIQELEAIDRMIATRSHVTFTVKETKGGGRVVEMEIARNGLVMRRQRFLALKSKHQNPVRIADRWIKRQIGILEDYAAESGRLAPSFLVVGHQLMSDEPIRSELVAMIKRMASRLNEIGTDDDKELAVDAMCLVNWKTQ